MWHYVTSAYLPTAVSRGKVAASTIYGLTMDELSRRIPDRFISYTQSMINRFMEYPKRISITTEKLNVRDGPSDYAEIIASIDKNDILISSETHDKDWDAVLYYTKEGNVFTGYVCNRYIIKLEVFEE